MFKNPVAVVIGLILVIALLLATSLVYRNGPEPVLSNEGVPAKTTVLRLGHNIPEDSALHQAAVRFAALVAERSGGRLQVEVFPAQQLGTDDKMLEMARRGELDVVLIPTAKVSVSVPAMQYADLPFYFPAREDLYDMLDGEPGRILLGKLREIDLVGVTFWENGFKHFTGNRPLRNPADFAGMNIRTMKSRLLMEQFHSFGAHTIPIDFHATRQALADRVVDGQENPLVAIVSMGLHEVQSHLTLSSHGYLGYIFMISAQAFDRLGANDQKLLIDTARELTPWERSETSRREAALLEMIRQSGVSIHQLTPGERAQFATATAHIPGIFEEVIGADVLAISEELLDRKYGGGEEIVVGLDVDLSQECRRSGLGFRRGATLAIDEINASGGVLGKQLKLIARDHKGLPSLGVSDMEYFGSRSDVVGVLGGVQSSVVVAQADVVRRLGLPFIVAWAAASEVVAQDRTADPVFRVSASDTLVAPFVIEHLLRRGRRPAILFENSLWGRGNLEAMRAQLRKRGLDFTVAESFNRGETNFELPVSRAEQGGADVLMMIAAPYEGGQIVKRLAERGVLTRVVSHWGISCGDFWGDNSEALAKVDLSFFQTFTFVGNDRVASRALERRYRARYAMDENLDVPVPQALAQAYDSVHLLALAIRQAGTTERAAVQRALESLPPFEGAVRTYAPAFSPRRHDALGVENFHMARYASNGAIVRAEH
ncbi:DctP family TRAP transporter solute-binding subunit [Azoarcus sp. L1K30]|uniref:DctP family TRAP transporter solute-binding subunit n=1 Tax=Azoarcus sp. L1K30 TaxID=2820277 RepID=UPI001B82B044|nr:DctP family TRAP transporter solute-binding subunit [Azoarcus sp. L1K30]MBR0567384.1 DctP family TRAP transporter solute-binding subunit [Azoarcus sp. L1K30]